MVLKGIDYEVEKGEKIVVEGYHKLTHGDKVEPVAASEPKESVESESNAN